jgi:flagellar hook-associated protein 2
MTAMSTFSISGLYSGFDTGALIQQLLALERIPITRLENKKTLLTNKTSAFSAFGAKLLALKTQAQYLSKPDTFRVLTASSSDSEIATASATTDAVPGSFDVVVTALAEHHKISSATYADPDESLNLAGEFVINGEGVYIESADSLANLVTKINAAQAGPLVGGERRSRRDKHLRCQLDRSPAVARDPQLDGDPEERHIRGSRVQRLRRRRHRNRRAL